MVRPRSIATCKMQEGVPDVLLAEERVYILCIVQGGLQLSRESQLARVHEVLDFSQGRHTPLAGATILLVDDTIL